MKIIYKQGDVCRATEDIIIQGCNAQGVQGSGVARVIREQFPEVYTEYRTQYETHGLELGEVIWANSNGKIFGNCITQEFYGRDGKQYVDYDAIRSCMGVVNDFAAGQYVAMPMIGSSLGGGDFGIISKIIEEESHDFTPVVYQL